MPQRKSKLPAVIPLMAMMFLPPLELSAAELVAVVQNIKSATGEIGCALFSSPTGFPLQSSEIPALWLKANAPTTTCEFHGLQGGTYALAVSHDLNGNHRTYTNFLGIPTEDWGVSNNVRPTLRAPSFAEASFNIEADGVKRITVEIDH
jgi:uncharacterized protein (DUF2141 family)